MTLRMLQHNAGDLFVPLLSNWTETLAAEYWKSTKIPRTEAGNIGDRHHPTVAKALEKTARLKNSVGHLCLAWLFDESCQKWKSSIAESLEATGIVRADLHQIVSDRSRLKMNLNSIQIVLLVFTFLIAEMKVGKVCLYYLSYCPPC